MLSIKDAFNLRNSFLEFEKTKEIKKEIKKEAEKQNVKKIDSNFIEWFLFEKIFSEGQSTLDIFMLKNFSQEENELLMSWKTPVFSIFKVRKEEKGLFTLLNLVNNQKYIAIKEENYSFNIGTFIIARILPFNNNQYIFCGNNLILNIKNNDDIYQVLAQFESVYPNSTFIDNDSKMQTSYKIQALEHQDFIEFFGNDEIILEGKEISEKLYEFYHYRYFQKKDKEGKTISKVFREKFGTYPEIPEIEIPKYISDLEEVGIIYDIIEGMNFLPWYGIFREVFKTKDFKQIIGYKECVLEYLKSDTISTLPFKRVISEYPENAQDVFKDILNKKKVVFPEDFEKIMGKYKKSILRASLKPSVISMTERTKALLRSKKIDDYVGLHFLDGFNKYNDVNDFYASIKQDLKS